MRMMRLGMVSTAHEQFKKLRMWAEAVDCLMCAERNVEALDMVKDLLEKEPTPKLWCCLGDLEKEPKHFETAWELSKHRFAGAQRSLGRYWFNKKELVKAVEAFKLALGINPMHAGIWFTLGVAEMQLERWDDACFTFSRCVAVESDNGQAWANLAATHSARENFKEARACMAEATKHSRENWRMWESFLGICMQLRDIQGCIQGMRRLVELDQAPRIAERVLGMLTAAVVNDVDGLWDFRTGKSYGNQLDQFFKYLTSRCTSEPCYWRFYAELQDSRRESAEALDSRMKQIRAAKARLWEERDPERFAIQLEDLLDCFKSVESGFADGDLETQARQQLQPFAYSVRDTVQRLQAKLDEVGKQPEWGAISDQITSLAARVEARATAVASAAA